MRLLLSDVDLSLGDRRIVHRASLEVPPGSFVGLVGPNGSGKTTLLRSVYRSLRPDAGVVRVGDREVWRMSSRDAAQRTAAVLQSDSSSAGLTVEEVVALGRTPHHGLVGRWRQRDREIVEDALARTATAAFADRAFGTLSGGERQRVLVARALAQQPRLLILDEPTNHLDIRARFELLALVRATGVTTLAVLHELEMAARTCDELVVLDGGRIVAAGPVLEVLTPGLLREVFGVNAEAQCHSDGVVRLHYAADPLAPTHHGLD
ncbi:ABC transporter ATP-binding protein [Actinoalloteichus hymeniacidonis]|uniref:ABC-type cobalamin/Fe3+-siderophore transport system, ATPase component n=1 Tax=Actinoalloteichus hymeniacidonis TaxID=340345 RepID=A0AAC9HSH5_9PSEU|nr:ABC transporter ATP-binding protein [Actinoalloteichus hymeniacidonis]AOS64842.1 ABC-type cobalamin/Fe3+-siderophore transport system, ATPase component [Actinoalloteichus hymeniacidonis]MBB5907083.1 iron complex transport system ATP-binding protein [Actinoalloteichus hymeniacidonis]